MISRIDTSSAFLSELIEYEQSLLKSATPWLKVMRAKGLERFKSLGLPTVKNEEWKYTSLASLAQKKFSFVGEQKLNDTLNLEKYLDRSEINIVYLNGFFSKELSNLDGLSSGLTIQNLKQAFKENERELQPLLSKYDPGTQGAFAALNTAYFHDGAFIKVKKNTVTDKLTHIIHVTNGKITDTISFPRTLIVLEPSSEAAVLESHISFANESYLTNALTDIFVTENAQLDYGKGQNESREAFHIGTTRIWQERDSNVEAFSLAAGSLLTRNDLSVTLDGPGAHATINGLYAITDQQHVDNHTAVDHKAPNCTSRELYKGILHNQARGVFNGKIFVQREAQLTNAYQLNKNLLLTKGCQIDTKPQLEIFADDVKCTHGATIGQLNEDEVFYLQSRAVPKSVAVKMLCRGFVDDILNEIKHASIHVKLEKLLTHVLSVIS